MKTSVDQYCINVTDLGKSVHSCMEAESESISPPECVGDGPVTAAFVNDPDGYIVEILQYHE